MASSVLDWTRQAHEDIEALEMAIVRDLKKTPKSHRDSVLQDHRVSHLLNRMGERQAQLAQLYQDEDGTRRAQIESMSAQGEKLFSAFYENVRHIREYHRKHNTAEISVDASGQYIDSAGKLLSEIDNDALVKFSGEEAFGRYLDVHQLYTRFCNLKGCPENKPDYITYLSGMCNLHKYEKHLKFTAEYKEYVKDLLDYLSGVYQRLNPLEDDTDTKLQEEFETLWQRGGIPGWEKIEEDPLFCVPCQKRFAKESVFTAHLTGKKHVLAEKKAKAQPNSGGVVNENTKGLALTEFSLLRFSEMLRDQIEATVAHVEKKQTRTLEEMEMDAEDDIEEAEQAVEESDDDDDGEEKIYNPLNLPLGWDGKPIPYWLYKLHGLNIEYKCEICGNYSYWGRRNFERHFGEWRHTHGMRCLKIPNTPHFKDITSIEEAYTLYEKIKADTKTSAWRSDIMEEFEDSQGNVLNKKTYEDLGRQGLL